MNSDYGLSFIVPAYNEERSILNTLESLYKALRSANIEFEIILVNDGSTDRTVEHVKELKWLKIINHPISIGYGNSIKSGIKNAEYDWIGIVDADGTYPVEDTPILIKEMQNGFDMVIGSRINIYTFDRPLKKVSRWIFNAMMKLLFNKEIQDPNCGFRIFKKSVSLNLLPFLCGTFSFTTSLTILSFGLSHFIKYIPTQYAKREGKSKVRHLKDGLMTLLLIIQGMTFFNPIKFFLLLSILIVIVVCIPAMVLAAIGWHTLSLYYMIFGATVSVTLAIGVLGDIIRISASQKNENN